MKSIVNISLNVTYANGGVTKAILDFQQYLEAPIISFDNRPDMRVEDREVNFVDSWVARPGPFPHIIFSARAKKLARQKLDELKPDALIVHSLYRAQCAWAQSEAKRRGIPYFVVPHGGLDDYVFQRGGVMKKAWLKWHQSYFENAAAVIFSTRREYEKGKKWIGRARAETILWALAEEIAGIDREKAHQWLLNRIGGKDDRRMLLYLGRLDPMKRPLETIRAFARAETKQTDLVITGNEHPISIESLKKEIADLGIQNVHITGPLYGNDKALALHGADGFISLSHRENFGYTTAEALMAELPVILSPGNDLSPEVAVANAGWFLDSMDGSLESGAISAFDSAPKGELLAMGLRGHEWAVENLAPECFKARILSLIDDVV
jgi:glycosyltransferase involved in cell wall biosynthesis